MLIESRTSEGGTFERQQFIRLTRKGIYGGLFARYSAPKIMTYSGEQKEQFGVAFLVTHDQAYRPLPQFTEAFRMVTTSIYHDEKTGKSSMQADLLHALLLGKVSYSEIASQTAYDYDDYIGRPVSLMIEPGRAPDKSGIYQNRILGFEPIDPEMRAAIKAVWSTRKIERNEKGIAYLASPVPVTADAAPQAKANTTPPADEDDDDFFAGLA